MSKNVLIAGVVGIVILAIVGSFLMIRGEKKEEATVVPTPTPPSVELLSQDALDVNLKSGAYPRYILTIDSIPQGAKTISYEITYDTTNKGTQGIIGSPVTLKEGQTTYTNDKIVFGSESRGKYSLDQGVNNIQVNIRLGYSDGSEKGWQGTLEI